MKNVGKSGSSHVKYTSVKSGDYDDEEGPNESGTGGGIALIGGRLKEQNMNLDILEKSIGRLGEISLQISEEVESQNRSLDSLEHEVENSQRQAETLTKKTEELLKMAGVKNLRCTIVILSLIAIFLFMLIIYT